MERLWRHEGLSAPARINERLVILRQIWPSFRTWWHHTYHTPPPIESVWHVYIPLAQWILEQKHAQSRRLYVFGIHGTIGRGKTTLANALALILKALIPGREGQALVLSLDDYYLPRSFRAKSAFRQRGYNPKGISNRGPAGTHDIELLWHHLAKMEQSGPRSRFELPVFDKQVDDRSAQPRIVKGKIAVVLLEGWMIGCRTDVAVNRMSTDLRRSVAQALLNYQHLFKRLDALLAFKPSTVQAIIAQRWRQQQTLNRLSGRKGMSRDQIHRFVNYFYRDAWEPGVSSPIPPESSVTFWAKMDSNYRFTELRSGGRS